MRRPCELRSDSSANPWLVARELEKTVTGRMRAPHHSASPRGMAEETWLAAGGVLYLDEAAEIKHLTVQTIAAAIERAPLPPRYVVLDTRPLVDANESQAARYAERLAWIERTLTAAAEAEELTP